METPAPPASIRLATKRLDVDLHGEGQPESGSGTVAGSHRCSSGVQPASALH